MAVASGEPVKAKMHDRRTTWRAVGAEIAAIGLIVLLPVLFFWRLLTPHLIDRAGIAWGDFAAQYYPLRLFVSRELAQGRLPLWNPYINGGQPALADPQSAVFYPPNLLLSFLVPHGELTLDALQGYVVVHFMLAGIFTYLFARYTLRRYGSPIARLSGLLAAIAFTFGGYLTSFPVQQLTILEAGVWLPLLLLLLDLAIERRSLAIFGLAALPLTSSWLAGHAQTTMYAVYLAIAYVLFKVGRGYDRGTAIKLAASGLFSLAIGTALAAVQLLPTYEFLGLSTRVDLAYNTTSFGLPLPELLGLLLPGAFGGRTLYVGVVALALAICAASSCVGQPAVRFWLAAALAGLLASLGGNAFLYSVLYLLVPGFAAVRNQERAVFVFSFSLSIMAAYGFAVLLGGGDRVAGTVVRLRQALLWAAGGSGALAILFLFAKTGAAQQAVANLGLVADRALFAGLILLIVAGLLRMREGNGIGPGALAALGICVLILDLFSVSWRANLAELKESVGYTPTKLTAALDALSAAGGQWRVSSEGLLPGGGSGGVVFRLRDVVGNTPLELRRYAQGVEGIGELQRSRLLGVGYWLTKRDMGKDGRFRELASEGDVRLYELAPELRLPRAYLTHDVTVLPDEAALREVSAVDLGRTSVVTNPARGALQLSALPADKQLPQEPPPIFVEETGTRQVLEAEAAAAGILVVSEMAYPGWRAFVDGVEVPVLRVQYMLRGVALSAGRHRVELRFEPESLTQGAEISGISAGLLVLLLCLVSGRRPFRQRP